MMLKDKAKRAKLYYYLRRIPRRLGLLKFSPYDVSELILWWKDGDYCSVNREGYWYGKALSRKDEERVRDYLNEKYSIQ